MGIAERQWTLIPAADPEKASQLATELGIDRVLADLLVQRGVETFEQARSFFRPRLEDLPRRKNSVHHVGAAAVGADGQPPADDLPEGRQIGADTEILLRPPARDTKTGHHLIEDQKRSGSVALLAQEF